MNRYAPGGESRTPTPFKPDWARGVVALMIVDLFVAFVAVDTISRIAAIGLRNTLFAVLIIRVLISLLLCGAAMTAFNSKGGKSA